MSVELRGSNSAEERLASEKLQFTQPTSAWGLIGAVDIYTNDDSKLDLATARLHTARRLNPTGGTEYFAVVEYSLTGQRLIDFLKLVAPNPQDNLYGVRDDWQMPDRTGDYFANLDSGHAKSLGTHWRDFQKHRPLFLDSINNQEVIDRLSERVRGEQGQGAFNEFFTSIGLPRELDFMGGQLKGTEQSSETLEVTDARRGVRVRLRPKIDVTLSFVPEGLETSNVLVPAVRWVKHQDGHRDLNLDFLGDSESGSARDLLTLPEGLPFDSRRVNLLTGLLAVAYFDPEVRRGWPKEMKLRRFGPKQFMGPAQVPVLALMRREQILDSKFFPAAEDYADRTFQGDVF